MSKQDAEAKLEQLNQRLQEGWNNVHSIKESQLEALRDVVREQWQQQQSAAAQKQQGSKQRASKSAAHKQDKTMRLGEKKRKGHSH